MPVTNNQRVSQIDLLIKHIYSLTLPSVNITNFNEQKAFLELRKNKLKDYLILCEQLEEILETFDQESASLEDVKKYLSERWDFGYFSIRDYYSNIKNLALLPEYLVQIIVKTFKYYFPSMIEIPVPSDVIKKTSNSTMVKPLKSLKKSKEKWQVTFSSIFNEKEIKRIRKHLLKDYPGKDDSKLNNWVENIGEVPWYADSKFD